MEARADTYIPDQCPLVASHSFRTCLSYASNWDRERRSIPEFFVGRTVCQPSPASAMAAIGGGGKNLWGRVEMVITSSTELHEKKNAAMRVSQTLEMPIIVKSRARSRNPSSAAKEVEDEIPRCRSTFSQVFQHRLNRLCDLTAAEQSWEAGMWGSRLLCFHPTGCTCDDDAPLPRPFPAPLGPLRSPCGWFPGPARIATVGELPGASWCPGRVDCKVNNVEAKPPRHQINESHADEV